jgi:fatty-acyl-CoA synthase
MVRRGYVAAFTDDRDRLVIIAERAAGTARDDPQPAMDAIRAMVSQKHGLAVFDVHFVPAGAIARTTSGKLARWACRARYLSGL